MYDLKKNYTNVKDKDNLRLNKWPRSHKRGLVESDTYVWKYGICLLSYLKNYVIVSLTGEYLRFCLDM